MSIFLPRLLPRYALPAGLWCALFFAAPAPAQILISEFMAANATGLQDEDGEYSDWIELFNSGASAVDLSGWHLTDSATNLTRWTFPATNLPAGGFLVVHASGKDRTSPRLHANFSLASDGEYLALVRPDGTTVEYEYPTYPEQFPDISYGLQTHGTNPLPGAGGPGFLIYRTPGASNTCLPAPHPLYSGDSVAQIDMVISDSGWNTLMNDPWNESFQTATIRFRHGDLDLVATNVGVQCRGATSREKQPRSFNIVFNAFVPGQKLLDMERLNLNSDANDPSMARPKLLNDLNNAVDLPTSYANHVALVVSNSTYHTAFFDAVRNNTQPVDDVFLKQRFGTARGNLYKCLYALGGTPASLESRGTNGYNYSSIPDVYNLQYAGGGDSSFQDLANFITLINQTSDTDFPNAIMNAFEVDDFLQRLALDVLSGNWDDYLANANNYHLFLHPETRRWVYIPYDFDNSFGVCWDSGNNHWSTASIYSWPNLYANTPLADRILAVPEFQKRYSFYMDQLMDTVFSTSLYASVYHYRSTMTDALPFPDSTSASNMKNSEKSRYSGWGTWNWTYDHFWYSYDYAQYTENWSLSYEYRDDAITNFIAVRRASALSQLNLQNIGPILSGFALTPSLPRTNDPVTVSIRALDDGSVTNVAFFYSFNGGATNSAAMVLQTDGSYSASLPAFGATGTVRYLVRALDNTGKATTHPYGGSTYAATVDIESPAFDLLVTEINYNPYALTAAETAAGVTDAQNLEFVELYNAGNAPMVLTGYKLQDGITATFPAFTLTNGTYAVVVKNTNQFRIRYTNAAIRIIGTFSGNLSNGGETLRLENASGGVIASITYSDSGDWPGRADGDGSSLELADLETPDYADPGAWRSSSEVGGSPGAASLGPDNRIVVNEVLTHTDPPLCDSIELFNTTASALNIGGWFLSDAKSNYRKFAIPSNTILAANGYVVFNETNHFNTSGGSNTNDFSLDGAHGDDVYLLETDAQGRLVRFADHVEFDAAINGESFGRWPNGSGRLYPMTTRTFGSANPGPRTGPLVISEIMYAPPSASNHLEFIEIANPAPDMAAVLTRCQLDGGVTYSFPTGQTLAAESALVILPFDPNAASNSALLASFQATYGVTNTSLLLGPYSGILDNSGERIRLLCPDEPPTEETNYYPMLTLDEVEYSPSAPWPTDAAGTDASLERSLPAAWGDSSTSWSAANPPTPGSLPEPAVTFTLTVASAHGSPSPSVGAHSIAADTALSNSVPSPVYSGSTRYLCTGWTLSTHAPASGSTNWMTMTLTNATTLTWLWSTQFLLSASSDSGGSVLPAGGWQPTGSNVELQATASNLFLFAGWTGDTNAIVSGNASTPAITVQMNAPVSLSAHFAADVPTYYASPSGSHTAPYTSWNTAATSLPALVAYVPAGSTVLVAAATYPLSSPLTIDKALHLKSAGGPASTILDGGNSTRVLSLSHADAILDGFTIQNGNSGNSSGGGARIEPAGSLLNCILWNNSSLKYGGGAALIGGGELRNCLLYENFAFEWGGGAYSYTESAPPIIQSCTFSLNSAGEGGGLYLNGSSILRNAIAWDNVSSSGSNIFLSGSGQTIQHTLSGPAQAGSGNLGADPRFHDGFRLAPDSPAINTGTNQSWMTSATDLDGRPRIAYASTDLGAYEGLLSTLDSDDDGVGDWQESRAGTDPFDPASTFLIADAQPMTGASGDFILTWPSVTGRSYRITYATNMTSPFSFVAFSNILADPPTNSFTNTLPAIPSGYYRLELED